MADEITLVTKKVSFDHLTPVRAYAALRAQTPGRSSFLIESGRPAEGAARYSVVGYRARSEAVFPPGGDLYDELSKSLESLPTPEGLAEQLSQALVGYLSHDAAHRVHGVEAWPDEENLSRMMRDSTVAVFDHLAHTITIAGRSPGAVNRFEYEMRHGPALEPLPVPDPEEITPHGATDVDDDAFGVRAMRAKGHVDKGAADRVVLSREFRAPLRNADPFDVYRALRVLAPSAYYFFLEFNEMPMAKGLSIAGLAAEPLVDASADRAARDATLGALRDAVPCATQVGAPPKGALKVIRELETQPRGILGGAIGFLSATGRARFFNTKTAVLLYQAQFFTSTSAEIDRATDPSTVAASTQRDARLALAAVHSAHLAAVARDEAEKRRREAEAKKEAEAEAATASAAASPEAAAASPEAAPPQAEPPKDAS